MTKSLAIIAARGGSKRIPHKNIKDFCGKPILAFSIEMAMESGVFDEIMVSTDDEQIADIAQKYGAVVPFMRSPKNSQDHTPVHEVWLEVLLNYLKNGKSFDFFCGLFPCAPLLKAQYVIEAQKILIAHPETPMVNPVVRFSFPIQRAMKIENGLLDFVWPEYHYTRSQDLPPRYHEAGQFYWLRTSAFLKAPAGDYPDSRPYEIPESEIQDIDNEEDWKIAEIKYKIRQMQKDKDKS